MWYYDPKSECLEEEDAEEESLDRTVTRHGHRHIQQVLLPKRKKKERLSPQPTNRQSIPGYIGVVELPTSCTPACGLHCRLPGSTISSLDYYEVLRTQPRFDLLLSVKI